MIEFSLACLDKSTGDSPGSRAASSPKLQSIISYALDPTKVDFLGTWHFSTVLNYCIGEVQRASLVLRALTNPLEIVRGVEPHRVRSFSRSLAML